MELSKLKVGQVHYRYLTGLGFIKPILFKTLKVTLL